MQRHWAIDELIDHWTLLPAEQEVLGTSKDANRLGLAVMLKAFQQEGRFLYHTTDVPSVVDYVSRQVGVHAGLYVTYDWRGRSSSTHRSLIRDYLNFRSFAESDAASLVAWLCEQVLPSHGVPMVGLARQLKVTVRISVAVIHKDSQGFGTRQTEDG